MSADFDTLALYLERQAAWSSPLRRHLYRKASLRTRSSVLDVGCGTGTVTADIAARTAGKVTGADSDQSMVEYASSRYPHIDFLVADCLSLPFEGASFDVVACHFLLMWVGDPARAVKEMSRVLASGGVLLACAEPDYGGKIEFPEHERYWEAREEALRRQGADPRIGRRLSSLFRSARLGVEVGVSATVWEGRQLSAELEAQQGMLRDELASVLGDEEARLVLDEERAQVEGGKVLTVPLFWAVGHKA